MRGRRSIRLLVAAATALLLAGCAGLPTSGAPNPGLAIGEDGEVPVFTPIAQGPQPGAGPEDIVDGFLEASMTPAGNWETAQEFLTDDFRQAWKPGTSVTIDKSVLTRQFDASVDAEDDTATTAEVKAQFDQVASVDVNGAYSATSKPATATYQLQRTEGGEWRISKAINGIVLDAETFLQVYQKYALKYFDPSWTHLVPDVRWFPRRPAMATTISRALITGQPSEWLAPAVRTAFSADMSLAGDAVTVDPSQVASVALSRTVLSASSSELARMRTQLEASLAGAGVSEVRFTVDGAPLDAGTVPIDGTIVDPGVLVLNDETFGRTASGDALEPVGGLTAQIAKIADPIRALDVSANASLAAMQLRDGRVFAVTAGNSAELDDRTGLIEPSLDPFDYTWTVPRDHPDALLAWSARVVRHPIAKAWPGAESISHLRVSADGARVAAVVTSNGQRRVLVAAVLRGEDSEPVELGEVHEIGRLPGAAHGLAWIGSDTVAVLAHSPDPVLISYIVGGPSSSSPAPDGAMGLSGAKTTTGLRVLTSDGSVYAQRGSSWQISVEDVRVLGTRAGY
ncbi:LpqB family beta-propeller domain-containing protein [Microbacterium suwonense]|uniref:Lipoprotein LpqB n=1 Tax=Microbacterium suwonense TaxID=683047 RepID=A0ABM8FTG3_9MICO|nr:LpqB family beta-propeller domain-containing protein [Microbacterium suwonense]BDZ38744.1 lipoprotein LpqB [Microbacterium suwonense]